MFVYYETLRGACQYQKDENPDQVDPTGQATPDVSVTIDRHQVDVVDEIPKLGRIITNNVICGRDFDNKIKSADTAYGT